MVAPLNADGLNRLIARVGEKDRAAFAQLYEATSSKLYGIVLRILSRRDLADEVLQDVYIRVWEKAATFDPQKASPITWLATIARNRCIDEVRRKQPVSIEDLPGIAEIPDTDLLAPEAIARDQDLARLERCLSALEPERQQMVRLAYLSGLSREELAARFNKPVPTIKTWLHRTLKQLKNCVSMP
jgi:RNA polymerase sigma-70 factor (ECF subfamily)